MKYLYNSLFLFCTSVSLHAQISISNERLTKPDEKIAYSCYEHKMKITGLSEQDTNLVVFSFGDSLRVSEHTFIYRPRKIGFDTIVILNNGKEIHREIYRVKNSPPPTIYLGDIRDSIVTKEELLKNPGLVYAYETEFLIPRNNVISFVVSFIKKNGKEKILKTTYSLVFKEEWGDFIWEAGEIKGADKFSLEDTYGSHFSPQQLKHIQKMKSGEKIRFHYATIIGESCPRKMGVNLVLTIK